MGGSLQDQNYARLAKSRQDDRCEAPKERQRLCGCGARNRPLSSLYLLGIKGNSTPLPRQRKTNGNSAADSLHFKFQIFSRQRAEADCIQPSGTSGQIAALSSGESKSRPFSCIHLPTMHFILLYRCRCQTPHCPCVPLPSSASTGHHLPAKASPICPTSYGTQNGHSSHCDLSGEPT